MDEKSGGVERGVNGRKNGKGMGVRGGERNRGSKDRDGRCGHACVAKGCERAGE